MLDILSRYDVLAAFWMTIRLTLFSAIGALVIGTVVAVMRVSPVPVLRRLGAIYVNVVRNTPLTLIMFFALAGVGIILQVNLVDQSSPTSVRDSAIRWAIVALSVYHAAFVCEAIRSGVNTVPIGQAEAARAIGLSFLPAARLIILPQAFRGAIAPLGNTLIALLKNSTVAAAASVTTETSSLMRTMIEFNSSYIYAIFFMFAIGYVILVIPIGLLTTSLSTRLAVRR